MSLFFSAFNSTNIFRWDTQYVTFSVRPSDRPSVCCAPYLRDQTGSYHNFWDTYVKWWYLQVLFSVLQNFDFLSCYGGKRAKSSPKWKQQLRRHTLYLRNYSIWSWFLVHLCHDFWYTCVKWCYLKAFFHFF